MKEIGIVRKVDELGRVVVPIELRKKYNITEGTPMEIFVDRGDIVLRKHQKLCFICNRTGDMELKDGTCICKQCAAEIVKAMEG